MEGRSPVVELNAERSSGIGKRRNAEQDWRDMDSMTYEAAYEVEPPGFDDRNDPEPGCSGCVSLWENAIPGKGTIRDCCFYGCSLEREEYERGCDWWSDEEPDGSAEENMRGPW